MEWLLALILILLIIIAIGIWMIILRLDRIVGKPEGLQLLPYQREQHYVRVKKTDY